MSPARRKDLITAVIFIIVGLTTVFFLIPYGVKVPSTVKSAALSPDFWPRIITYGAIAASIFLLIETLVLQQPNTEDEDVDEDAKYKLDTLPSVLRVLVLVAVLFGFYASLTTLGVVVASILLIFGLMLFFGERKLWLIAVLSFGVPTLLYVFFRYVASVPIPLGIFGN